MQPLIYKKYLLEKYPGKGGWTYARIPDIKPDQKAPFGWVKVKGSIDGYPIKQYNLMPIGNGMLFLPVKAAIRKVIKKEAGDWVDVILEQDLEDEIMPEDFLLCLKEEPLAERNFLSLTKEEQSKIIRFIYNAQKNETRVTRIADTLAMLMRKGC